MPSDRPTYPIAAFASFAFRGSAASAAAILATIALRPTQVDSKLRKHPSSRKRDQKGAAVPARTPQSQGKSRKNWHNRATAAPIGLALVVLAAFVVISPVLQGQLCSRLCSPFRHPLSSQSSFIVQGE